MDGGADANAATRALADSATVAEAEAVVEADEESTVAAVVPVIIIGSTIVAMPPIRLELLA